MGIGIHWLRVRQIIIRERKKYEKARLTSETAEKYLKRLLHYMESKKPYLDPDISLHKLSEGIKIPHHYRIEEARKILSDSKNHLPILGVAFEVGFNSKSAFNRAFKKNVNMTPSDFKKERNNFLKEGE